MGILIGSDRQFYRDICRGVGRYAAETGRWIIAAEPTRWCRSSNTRLGFQRLPACDGLIALIEDEHGLDEIQRLGVPVVNLSSRFNYPELPAVLPDHAALAKLAFEYFIERGFKRFGYCGLDNAAAVRGLPFEKVVTGAGYECHGFAVTPRSADAWGTAADHERMAVWLHRLPKPIAILAHNDIRGRHLADLAFQQRISVPDQVAILGVDNETPHCDLCIPPLSSVDIDAPRIGYEAARLLERLMTATPQPGMAVRVPPRGIVTRGSTDVRLTADPLVRRALRHIRDHAAAGIDTETLAREFVVSPSTLRKRFLSAVGYTPHEAIVRAKLGVARALLAETRLTVDTVAKQCGFRHGEYLTAVFRKRYAITPRRFRQELRAGRGPERARGD